MGRNEDFDNSLWAHPRFEELSALASLFYIWSWTNPNCGMGGIYEVGRRTMTQSKVETHELPNVLKELAETRWLFYEDGVLWVCARVKRLRSRTHQIAVSAVRDVAAITAGHPLRVAWLRRYGQESWLADELKDAGIDPHEQTVSVNLTGTSPEVPLSGSGLRPCSDRGIEQEKKVDARARSAIISELFAYWQQQCEHPHAKLSPDRRRKIDARLREGYEPQQVREAIEGAARAAHVSDDGRRFDDIELVCRNASKLESFIVRRTASPIRAAAIPPRRENASDLLKALDEAKAQRETKGAVVEHG